MGSQDEFEFLRRMKKSKWVEDWIYGSAGWKTYSLFSLIGFQ